MIKNIGDRITLVGVAHVLPKSKREVRKVIREEKPELVGVELDRQRYLYLLSPEKDRSSGIPLSGVGIVAKIMQFIQKRIGRKTGMMPGEEMMAAIKESKDVGADVQLLDRDVNVTLQRLLSKMPLKEKIMIFGQILFAPLLFTQDFELKDVTDEEVVKKLILQTKNISETTYEVLIQERNKYMADRITQAMRSEQGKMVAVVGAGHIPGLAKILKKRLDAGVFEPLDEYRMEWQI